MSDYKLKDLPKSTRSEILFHAMIEKEVVEMEYGTMTINIILKNKIPIMKSLNIVKSIRRKYK